MGSIFRGAENSLAASKSQQGIDKEKVLVCMLASTRAHELTFPSIKRHVLDELNADLALALLIDDTYDRSNPFWEQAKYRWTGRDRADYGEVYDEAQQWLCREYNIAPPDWRVLLGITGIWMGGIKSPNPQPSASSILPFCRWFLLRHLQQEGILDRYDRFVITRSDFVWLCPHPPLSILGQDSIWVPDGEDWGGVNDRHLVVSRAHVVDCLNLIEDIVLRPTELYDEMKAHSNWNNEQFFAHHLQRKGLLQRVKSFPYVMYTARSKTDKPSTWSFGTYEPAVGHFVKYPYEFRMAYAYASAIRNRADWEGKKWTEFDPSTIHAQPAPLLHLIRYKCVKAYHQWLVTWRKPARFNRLVSFCKSALKRMLPGR